MHLFRIRVLSSAHCLKLVRPNHQYNLQARFGDTTSEALHWMLHPKYPKANSKFSWGARKKTQSRIGCGVEQIARKNKIVIEIGWDDIFTFEGISNPKWTLNLSLYSKYILARPHRKPFGLFYPLETCFSAESFHPQNSSSG